jgi:hypothetical protein
MWFFIMNAVGIIYGFQDFVVRRCLSKSQTLVKPSMRRNYLQHYDCGIAGNVGDAGSDYLGRSETQRDRK